MKISKKEYEKSIRKTMSYIENHPGCYSIDIGVVLKLQPEVVLKILTQLMKDGRIKYVER